MTVCGKIKNTHWDLGKRELEDEEAEEGNGAGLTMTMFICAQ